MTHGISGRRHGVFQAGLMSALLDGVYDGDTTLGTLLERGDFGLGTFNALDGELVILDGICYQLRAGAAVLADPAQLTPFAVVTTFAPVLVTELPPNTPRDRVVAAVGDLTRSENYLYAVRVTGDFAWVRTRTAARQSKPYPPLRAATRNEPVYQFDDVRGIVAGFRTPTFEQGIGVPGGHVHFIDDERTKGGHVLDYVLRRGTLEVCPATDLHLALPLTEEFGRAHLSPVDLAEQIQQTENHA